MASKEPELKPDLVDATDESLVLFEKDEWADGFTWRTVLGTIFVGIVIMPSAIYMGLISGSGLAGAAEWMTIILFIEIGKRSFVTLKKQEVVILFWAASGVMALGTTFGSGASLVGGPFSTLIWNQYLIQSPQAEGFGITNHIPSWLVPSDPSVLATRTFFHSAWLVPIILVTITVVLNYVLTMAGGYLLYRITRDIEKLPFPMAPVSAGGATALAETSGKKESWRWRSFSVGAMIGLAFGAIYLGVPTITGVLTADPIMILPIPFADATIQIGNILPASVFGIATDLGLVLVGFVLPFRVVLGIFTGSITFGIILNPILYHFNILHSWEPGLSVIPTLIVNGLDFHISLGIGLAITVAVIGIGGVIRKLVFTKRDTESAGLTAEEQADLKGRGEFSMVLAALICAASLCVYVFIVHLLVPGFPVPILLIFAFVYTPLVSYITARLVGVTGMATGASIPYVRESAFILSGYKGADIWFAPVPLFDVGGGAQSFRILELTRTRFISIVKVGLLSAVMMLVFSFMFWSIIWRLAPIPSSTYPFVQKLWPLFATSQCIVASSTLASDRITSDGLSHDFEATPILPDESTKTITPEEGYIGYFLDLRPDTQEKYASPPRGQPVIAITGPSESQALGLIEDHEVAAILVVLPDEKPTLDQVDALRDQYTDYPNRRYWIGESRFAEMIPQIHGSDELTIKRRRNFFIEALNGYYIGAGVIASALMFIAVAVFGGPSAFVYGIIGGAAAWPHMVIPQMAGALLGRYVLKKRFGEEKWKAYAPVLLAGYMCGVGLVGTIAVAFALLAKAVSQVII